MRPRALLLSLLLPSALAASGCGGAPSRPELSLEHPAHPLAETPAERPAPSPFERTPTFSVPGASNPDPAPAAGHEHSGRAEGGAPVEYTCPMHPDVVRSEPGECPVCGMALRPRTPRAHGAEEPGESRP